MACCGKNRWRPTIETHEAPTVSYTPPAPIFQSFIYVGNTNLTAIGVATGRHYRFPGTGAIVAVDMRDAPSMAGVPNVRRFQPVD
jgi:hypothetical protein